MANTKNTLHLVLKKKWFDMIASEEKKEEYRDFNYYSIPRFLELIPPVDFGFKAFKSVSAIFSYMKGLKASREMAVQEMLNICCEFRKYDTVTFQLGYAKNAERCVVEFISLSIGEGLEKWGAESNKNYFILKFGEII